MFKCGFPITKILYPSNLSGYKRIGIHNDSVFGKSRVNKYGTGGLDAGTEQWQQLLKEAAYTPQDGELFWSSWNLDTGVYCDGFDALCQFSEHRFTSLSVFAWIPGQRGRREYHYGQMEKADID